MPGTLGTGALPALDYQELPIFHPLEFTPEWRLSIGVRFLGDAQTGGPKPPVFQLA
jgi:hypothetical protein